jgi:hypothetical protein
MESGTRSSLIQCLFPALVLYYRRGLLMALGTSLARGALLVVVVLMALAASNAQLRLRDGGDPEATDFTVRHSELVSETAFAFAVMDRVQDYSYDSPFLHIITGPIPRVLWSDKPEIKALIVYTRYIWGTDITVRGGNTLPSIVGQYYLGWGWFGIFEIGLWLGLLVRLGDNASHRLAPTATGHVGYAALLIWVFVGFRTLGFFFFMPAAMTVVMGWLLARPPRSAPATAPLLAHADAARHSP